MKKAYRRLALRHHPDREPEDTGAFEAVAEAFDVLSSAQHKGIYDRYGEDGLKAGATDAAGAVQGGTYAFNKTPEEIFANFFGTKNPYAALQDMSASFAGLTATPQAPQGKHRVAELECTLEEVFYGCQKKAPFVRKVLDVDGSVSVETLTFTINVKPGTADGTRYVFPGAGNVTPKAEPGPVIFMLKTLPHALFTRRGADLVYPVRVPLCSALTGTTLQIKSLDNRTLSVPVTLIVQSGSTTTLVGEGMPLPGGGKGDLEVAFAVVFPAGLSQAQRTLMKSAFFLPKNLTDAQKDAVDAFTKAFSHNTEGWSTGFAV